VYSPHGREDLWPQVAVDALDLLGSPWPLRVLIFRRHQHGRDQGARARAGDHIEVVRDPGIIIPCIILFTIIFQPLRRDQITKPLFEYFDTDQHLIEEVSNDKGLVSGSIL